MTIQEAAEVYKQAVAEVARCQAEYDLAQDTLEEKRKALALAWDLVASTAYDLQRAARE